MKLNRLVAVGLAVLISILATTGPVFAEKQPPAGKVNINTASVQQLSVLPGVGEKLAGRIVEYRQKSGGFKSTQELMNVQGIGEKNFSKIQAYLTTGDGAAKAQAR